MMNAAQLEEKYKYSDIKAEIVAADLVQNGKNLDNIVIRPVGLFTRKFRNDILHYEDVDSSTGNEDSLLFIDVSREGLFDALPQGLFHQPSGKRIEGLENQIEELRKQRQEEIEAKKFFSVFEKEFNQCKVLVELEERKSIFGFGESFNSDLFADIWVELRDIAPKFHQYLFQILPIAHKCRGNVHLSSLLLGFVVNEKVHISVSVEPKFQKNSFPGNELNKQFLGTDFVLGDNTPSYDSEYKIIIGPVAKKKLKHFLHGGEYEKVILYLLEYFIPFDADAKLELVLENEAENLFLREGENYCFLGYDSKI